jgi:hypothetical protein
LIIRDLPETDYHTRPELSSSGARSLLPEYKGSPKTYRWYQENPRTSRAFDIGHAVHAKVLGVGAGVIVYPDEHLTPSGNVSTKQTTRDWEEDTRNAGYTPIAPDDAARIDAMAEAVLAHPTARAILEVAVHREVSVFGEVDGVPCRARFDAISDGTRSGVIAADLKTGDDATPNGFTHSIMKYGYDFQQGWYGDVHLASEGVAVDTFAFLVVEKSAPFEVAVHRLPDMWVQMGRRKGQEARRIYAECVSSGVWPGYDTDVQVLEPPAWAVIEHEMRYETTEITI